MSTKRAKTPSVPRYRNQAAQRVLAVLSAFAGPEASLGVTELAQRLGTNKNMIFRALATPDHDLEIAFYTPPTTVQRARLDRWLAAYAERVRVEGLAEPERAARMNACNPLYVPRNYLVQEVIEATERGDRAALPELLDVLRRPYDDQPGRERFARKRPDWARHRPGCSMLSCSS